MIKARNLRKATVVSTYFFKSSQKTPFFNQRTCDHLNLIEFDLDDHAPMETETSNGLLQLTTNVMVGKIALDDEHMQTESDKGFQWCLVMESAVDEFDGT